MENRIKVQENRVGVTVGVTVAAGCCGFVAMIGRLVGCLAAQSALFFWPTILGCKDV